MLTLMYLLGKHCWNLRLLTGTAAVNIISNIISALRRQRPIRARNGEKNVLVMFPEYPACLNAR
jgi:hypothetical protein